MIYKLKILWGEYDYMYWESRAFTASGITYGDGFRVDHGDDHVYGFGMPSGLGFSYQVDIKTARFFDKVLI